MGVVLVTKRVKARNKKTYMQVPIYTEDVARYILGSYYNYLHSNLLTEKKWKHIVTMLVSKLELAVELNVQTDTYHRDDIQRHLRCLRYALKEKQLAEPHCIIALIALCFELLGGSPYNADMKHARWKRDFFLRRFRRLHYIQDDMDKVRLIQHCGRLEEFRKVVDPDVVDDHFRKLRTFRKCLEWYESEYPALYCKLF
jgi:hypothetical protein